MFDLSNLTRWFDLLTAILDKLIIPFLGRVSLIHVRGDQVLAESDSKGE